MNKCSICEKRGPKSNHKACLALLDENSGYNPEYLQDYETVFAREGNEIVVTDNEGNLKSYFRTNAKTMAEYIKEYPKVFGKIIDEVFYCEEC